jgi:ribosomal-protein-alanine N-acetyltransferase
VIRPATAADLPALAALHARCFPPAEAWSESALGGLLAMPGAYALWQPAAGLVLARVAADEAEILTLGVAPAARRQGVGAALLTAALALAAKAGAATMFLEVAASNTAAQALYAAAGFSAAGRRAGYYGAGEDALILGRLL